MQLLLGLDDTDTLDSEMGTGKISRKLAGRLESGFAGLSLVGSVRQQLLLDERVPFTTHNSSATLVFDADAPDVDAVVEHAVAYVTDVAAEGSDPGICVASASEVTDAVVSFGLRAKEELVSKTDAYAVAREEDVFLEEYGGTGDGVIGALGAVGLTAAGEDGRFVAFGRIREYGETVSVEELVGDGIRVVGPDGDALEAGTVETGGWIRPQLRGGRPTLPVEPVESGADAFRPANLH